MARLERLVFKKETVLCVRSVKNKTTSTSRARGEAGCGDLSS